MQRPTRSRRKSNIHWPVPHGRGLAMLHVAMFEAVNAIERRYAPYKLNLAADRDTSKEAAAAAAGYHVLAALYPDQKTDLDAALVAMLAGVAEGDAKTKGIDVRQEGCGGDHCAARKRWSGRAGKLSTAHQPGRLHPHDGTGIFDGGRHNALEHDIRLAIPARAAAGRSRRRPGPGISMRSAS